jgi:hypothetical protein
VLLDERQHIRIKISILDVEQADPEKLVALNNRLLDRELDSTPSRFRQFPGRDPKAGLAFVQYAPRSGGSLNQTRLARSISGGPFSARLSF